ncbi:MAG: ribonuclease E/G [Pseudomonadota bacterium]
MSKLMLIDAAHPEETRVALVSDNQVDDFDFETTGKEQLRGNIYLAKVTRVEPSLQAAFVEYGGNRHGFLAFSEIHPDYYQLPQEDREALLREAAEAAAEDDDDLDVDDDDDGHASEEDTELDASEDDEAADSETSSDDEDSAEASIDEGANDKPAPKKEAAQRRQRKSRNLQKRYKIQEVIRRRQVMLVQVVKEERGNKGAALTTYLSLAGRYSVLMPNTPRGGGISRKIANGADRKRLKQVMTELDVPTGMGLIVRTAGAKRTKTDIKRDYDYLIKLWDQIRERTLSSMAPAMIHEEGGLVHRAMRDLYDKDVEAVLIDGEAAYKEAKELAQLLMPSQAKKVQRWKEPKPLFVAEGVEEQLDQIFSPTVQMKSGGYLVINQTEALVAIDVNSGKSTKERNIEQTALRTNLEAAEEACRQMRLRDLAGLVVIDFIDMDEAKNNRAVERKLKDCLKFDRARVQHGKLSQFGLMEISRQRRRAGVLQASSDPCPACNGTGRVRSVDSAALQLLRTLEARAAAGGLLSITVEAPTEVALYLLNNKRDAFTKIEESAGFAISVQSSDSLLAGDFTIHADKDPNYKPPKKDRSENRRRRQERVEDDQETGLEVIDADEDADDSDEEDSADTEASEDGDNEGARRKRRRRGRRGGRRRKRGGDDKDTQASDSDDIPTGPVVESGSAEIPPPPKRTPKPDATPEDGGAYLDGLAITATEMIDAESLSETAEHEETASEEEDGEAKRPRRRRRRRKSKSAENAAAEANESAPETDTPPEVSEAESAGEPPVDVTSQTEETVQATPLEHTEPEEAKAPAVETPEAKEPEPEEPAKPKRRGWWSRRKAG